MSKISVSVLARKLYTRSDVINGRWPEIFLGGEEEKKPCNRKKIQLFDFRPNELHSAPCEIHLATSRVQNMGGGSTVADGK